MITLDNGAKKIENSDNWREIFDAHNDSVDALTTEAENLNGALAMVISGATEAQIAAGKYVYWNGGLYLVSNAIPAGTTITSANYTSYLTAVTDGGLNALNDQIANLGVAKMLFLPGLELTFNSGVCTYRDSRITANMEGFATVRYKTNVYLWYIIAIQVLMDGIANIYVRKEDGTAPANGTMIVANYLFIENPN